MKELGICMAGLEEAIESYTRLVADRFRNVVYMEIGVASGQTLVSVTQVLRESAKEWTSIGVDLPNGYSLERNGILQRANALGIQCEIVELNDSFGLFPAKRFAINVVLKPVQQFLQTNFVGSIELVLIDGCHGKECSMKEFLMLEPLMSEGGIVMFHDFGEDSVGEPQPHCGTGDVLGACRELGLIDNHRRNWNHLATVVGDKEKNGRDLGVFEKST
jgi:hypothetical protein